MTDAGGPRDLYFIHGMWSTPAVWGELRHHFEGRGHRTFAPALPWHDRTRDQPPHPELAAASLRDYIDFLVDDIAQRAVLPVICGHSMGGFLAQAVAARVSAPGLVLLSPGATATTGAPSLDALRTTWGVIGRWGWWNAPTLIDPARARWGIYNGVPDAVADAEIAALVWDSGRVLFELGLPWAARTGSATVDHAAIRCPALVVVGSDDRITPAAVARATARALPGPVDYRELPGIGHWLFHDPVVGRVAGLIDDWLAAPLSPS